MGMYTELALSVEFVKDIPDEVVEVLEYLVNGADEPTRLPEHELFKLDRWQQLGRGSSYYFENPDPVGDFHLDDITHHYHMTIWCNLKNYRGEIWAFCDWIAPYVDAKWGQRIVGFFRYEEDEVPSFVAFKQGKVKFLKVEIVAESLERVEADD